METFATEFINFDIKESHAFPSFSRPHEDLEIDIFICRVYGPLNNSILSLLNALALSLNINVKGVFVFALQS